VGSQVTRRKFITLIGGVAAWPLASRAQQTDRMRRIGVLLPYPKDGTEIETRVQAFRQELARLGWSEGSNVQIDERWSTDNTDLVRANATNLVASRRYCYGGRSYRSNPDKIDSFHSDCSRSNQRCDRVRRGGKVSLIRAAT
jgi:hypothetical protein